MMARAPVICITHGGGPMPVLEPLWGSHGHDALNKSLETRVRNFLKIGTPDAPKAIVVITPHWRPEQPTVTMNESPKICYDFEPSHPPAAWDIKYEAPGSAKISEEVYEALTSAGLKPAKDFERGWDHGIFIPFIFISPKGEVPLISLSISSDSDPAFYFSMGQALEQLRQSGIAILGSGFASYHNVPMMRKLFQADAASPEMIEWRTKVAEFNEALKTAVLTADPEERKAGLIKWREFPHAFDTHPDQEDEHILPLFASAGAAGHSKGGYFKDPFGGVDVYTFFWSDDKYEME